ncbi:MAG: transglutaminase domain-containing protein, partial [Candidatus Bathyarchaeota archaeon]|nr:transglutaminase domain-containing protein [Candidatus Bathyarchaeota archaeon]
MKGYQKLAVFIAVLLLSVSFISTAIDILGDISDVDLDENLRKEMTAAKPAEMAEADRSEGEVVSVEAALTGAIRPLFKIQQPPETSYLRRSVLEVYGDGEWAPTESPNAIPYDGKEIPLNVSGYDSVEDVHFSIIPLVNLSGFVPVTLSVYYLDFSEPLERYPELEAFSSPAPFSSLYGVYYARYEFSEATLRAAELRYPKNCLELPAELADRLGDLASEIVGGASTPWEMLRSIEDHLKLNYEYDEEFEPAPPGIDPIEWFLFNETRGICTHFNSAFVLLARSIGLPARIVNGFLVSPDAENQIVMPKQAHVYAEVPFKRLGWITFDATPERIEERPQLGYKIQTVTNITDNDKVGVKGGHFSVYGNVTTLNGSAVDGISVEVFLKVSKNDTGVGCGFGEVREGLFNVTCEASPDLEVGPYMLVAHALGNAVYEESWSDPPIMIVAETELLLEAPGRAHVGESITLRCRLMDSSNGQPIGDMTLLMDVDGETVSLTTDSTGSASMIHAYETEGNKTVTLKFEESDYYRGSSNAVSIALAVPPPSTQSLLDMLITFPYNLILAATSAATGAVVVLVRRRGRQPIPPGFKEEEAGPAEVMEDEGYLAFTNYKEGVVKLFNHFYASAQRRYGEIQDSLTPREFQQILLREVPEKGMRALEDLVSAFEIANYSEMYSTKEDYDRCRAA